MSQATPRRRLVRASASPGRLALLAQMGLDPDAVIPADIDETPRRSESPRARVQRLSAEKAKAAADVAGNRPGISRFVVASPPPDPCFRRPRPPLIPGSH